MKACTALLAAALVIGAAPMVPAAMAQSSTYNPDSAPPKAIGPWVLQERTKYCVLAYQKSFGFPAIILGTGNSSAYSFAIPHDPSLKEGTGARVTISIGGEAPEPVEAYVVGHRGEITNLGIFIPLAKLENAPKDAVISVARNGAVIHEFTLVEFKKAVGPLKKCTAGLKAKSGK